MSLVDAIPQSIREIGRIRAQGIAAKGAYGKSLADIGQMVSEIPGQMRQQEQQDQTNKLNAQRLEMGDLELAEKKRTAAADEALSNAMMNSVGPDGRPDRAKLQQHLAGTPAASNWLRISQELDKMEKSQIDLQSSKLSLEDSERDEMGALANAASAAGDDAESQAGVLLTGIASRVKQNRMTAEEANPIIAGILNDDGTPDGGKVKSTIDRMRAASKEQRQLASTDAAKDAQTESALASAADRKSITSARDLATKLSNFSRQLAGTTTQARYKTVYQGIPEDIQGYFDSPEEWTVDSPRHAGDVLLTADQRADNRRADIAATRADEAAAETRRHNAAVEANGARREERLTRGPGTTDRGNADIVRAYDAFLSVWDRNYPKPAATAMDANGNPLPNPPAPPTLDKWSVMTPAERQAVIKDPKARIDDTEMTRRMNSGSAAVVSADVQKTTEHLPKVAQGRPGAGKAIKADALKTLAKQWGLSEEDARAQAIEQGYAIVK